MPPILAFIASQPHNGLGPQHAVQVPDNMILSITRLTTTSTTATAPTPTTAIIAAALPTTPASPATTMIETSNANASTSSVSGSTAAGIVLGTTMGILVLVTIVWKCCYHPQSILHVQARHYEGEAHEEAEGEAPEEEEGDVSVRGGGGEDWLGRLRGYALRRPERASIRRAGRGGNGAGDFWEGRGGDADVEGTVIEVAVGGADEVEIVGGVVRSTANVLGRVRSDWLRKAGLWAGR